MLMESLDREIKEHENVIEKLTLANEISDDVVEENSDDVVGENNDNVAVEENSDDVVEENSDDWEYFGDLAGTYNQQRYGCTPK